jgi:hypothetical protein
MPDLRALNSPPFSWRSDALRGCHHALIAGSNPARASCSQVAAGGDRWLLMAARGHGPVMRRPGSQWDGVIERPSAYRKGGRSVPGAVVSAAPSPDSGAGRRHHGKSGTWSDVTWANWPCRVTSPTLVTGHPPLGTHRPPVSSGIPMTTATTTRIKKATKTTSWAHQPELTRWPTA